MAVPSGIILDEPNILVSQSFAITEDASFGRITGTVELIFDTCDKAVVGQSVTFDPNNAQRLVYGSTIYYIIDQNLASLREAPPV